MDHLITITEPAKVGGIPVAVWQRNKIAEAIAKYHVRRISGDMSERAAASMLQARLVAITALTDAVEGRRF